MTGSRATRREALRRLAFTVAVGALLAGCGRGGLDNAASVPNSAPANPARVPPGSEISLRSISGLGSVLVDADGYTLYLFEKDDRSSSTCAGLCASEWPPLIAADGAALPEAGPGVREKLLGETDVKGEGEVITYNRWPLYTWAGDYAPGDATGEQVSNFGSPWYVVNASGDAVKVRRGL
jgi:predicted lipoprotein with Yx(FWY)xxD motif